MQKNVSQRLITQGHLVFVVQYNKYLTMIALKWKTDDLILHFYGTVMDIKIEKY